MRGIAKGYNRWKLLREYLAVNSVLKAGLATLLDSLEKMSWSVKESGGQE